jgi:hypothetical protein
VLQRFGERPERLGLRAEERRGRHGVTADVGFGAPDGVRRAYLRELRGGSRTKAAKLRKRMIARNRKHPADAQKRKISKAGLAEKMSPAYKKMLAKVEGTAEGRKALARYRKFWGIPYPTDIRIIDLPGPKTKTKFLVGMGRAGKGGKIQKKDGGTTRAKGAKIAAVDASGKQIFLLSGRNSTAPEQKLTEVGVAEETHYVPTGTMEKAGTFKKNKYWVHRHDDDGGRFPKVYKDQAGNYVYGRGTYSVTDWIRR